MRDHDTIDAELRLIAAARRTLLEDGSPPPSIGQADPLLDERLSTGEVRQ